jgi:serine/threonine protein kinase
MSTDTMGELHRRVTFFETRQMCGADGDPPSFAGYKLLEFLGRGSFGQVFRARHPDLECDVAIKLTKRVGWDDRDLDEARALAKVKHPNVAHVNAVGTVGDIRYVEMDVVNGTSLSAWAAGQEVDRVLKVLHQIGEGLDAAHRAGVVHKDVKPRNVMIDVNGNAVVIDFNLAMAEGKAGRRTGWLPR